MPESLRPLVLPLIVAALAAALYVTRVSDEMADFAVYRTAAERALDAAPLYRPEDGHYTFKYAPAFALAMAPFAILHPDAAQVAWFAISVGLLMAFIRWSVSGLPARRLSRRVLTILTVVFMAKFFAHELTLGQANLLLGTLLVGALLAAQIDLPRVAGVLVGIAFFVKPYALLLLPWLVFSHGLAAGLAAAGVMTAGLFLPALVYGWTANLGLLTDWFALVTESTAPTLLGADNVSLAAMWAKWIGPGQTASVLALVTAAAALGFPALAWLRRRPVFEPDYLEVAQLMVLMPLISPQGWDYVLLLATPAAVCLLDRWRELGRVWQAATATSLAVMGLTLFDVMGRALYGRFMALSLVTVAALVLPVALWHLRQRELA